MFLRQHKLFGASRLAQHTSPFSFFSDTMAAVDEIDSAYSAGDSLHSSLQDHRDDDVVDVEPAARNFDYPASVNRPRPRAVTEEQDGITIDKASNKKETKESSEELADFEETGKWGSVSRKEILCVAVTLLCVVVGVAVAIFFLVNKKGGEKAVVAPPVATVVSETVYNSDSQQYTALLLAIQANAPAVVSASILKSLPTDMSALRAVDAYSQAASWLLFLDNVSVRLESDLLPRFVMATTHYANGGANWTDSENWLGLEDVCYWHGIRCNIKKEVMEVDLSAEGLTGTIHEAWALLNNCTSILLNDNDLSGPIPGEAFGSMKALTYLVLKSNHLTGTVPSSLVNSGTIRT